MVRLFSRCWAGTWHAWHLACKAVLGIISTSACRADAKLMRVVLDVDTYGPGSARRVVEVVAGTQDKPPKSEIQVELMPTVRRVCAPALAWFRIGIAAAVLLLAC